MKKKKNQMKNAQSKITTLLWRYAEKKIFENSFVGYKLFCGIILWNKFYILEIDLSCR